MYAVLVIILIFLMPLIYSAGDHNSVMCNLKGFWSSSDDFNKDAEISSFNLYIGDKKNNLYSGYLLMIGEDNDVIINEPIEFCLTNIPKNILSRDKTFKLVFTEKETELLPTTLTFNYSCTSGKITFCDAKKVYAVFFKNNVVTELERIKDETNNPKQNQQLNIPIKLPKILKKKA